MNTINLIKPNTQTRDIVNFFELPEEWQAEARRNLDEYAEENSYLEPLDGQNPTDHVLWDLSEAMAQDGCHKGFFFNAGIGISNNSAMLLNIDDCFETATILFV